MMSTALPSSSYACLVQQDAQAYLQNSCSYDFRTELEAHALNVLQEPILPPESQARACSKSAIAHHSPTHSCKTPACSNVDGDDPSSPCQRQSNPNDPAPAVGGVADSTLPPSTSSPPAVAANRETEASLRSYLEASPEETLPCVFSPFSSGASSVSSSEDTASIADAKSPACTREGNCSRSNSGISPSVSGTRKTTSVESDEEMTAGEDVRREKAIKLPQRKGGMQLWQFLYALLSDPDKKYSELIEWTSNVKEREFRLHEPDSIAIWWGDHKNKRNMSYDKLSRSLRYYYDKGIIRKINGERYVYRFCIHPEVMYKHIGNSDCRPKLKPMPQAAKNVMSKYNRTYPGMVYSQPPLFPGGSYAMPTAGHFPTTHQQPPVTCSGYPSYEMNVMPSPFDTSSNYCTPHPDASLAIECQLYQSTVKMRSFPPHHMVPMRRCASDSAGYYSNGTLDQRNYTLVGQSTLQESTFPFLFNSQPLPQLNSLGSELVHSVPAPESPTGITSPHSSTYSSQILPSYSSLYHSSSNDWELLMNMSESLSHSL